MKFSTNQKKLVYRIVFYLFFLLSLLLVPIICATKYEVSALIFFSPYIVYELIVIISIVFLAEYWLFTKLGIKIENEELRFKVIGWLIFLLFFGSKMILGLFGVL